MFQDLFAFSCPNRGMDLLDERPVPEHAHEVKADAREFAAEHIEPNAKEYFRSGEYPHEILQAGMNAGLVAQDIGEEYGGRGLDLEQVLAIAEEFYRADAGIALTLQLASFGAEIVEDHGADHLKEEYLRPVAENDQITGLRYSSLRWSAPWSSTISAPKLASCSVSAIPASAR